MKENIDMDIITNSPKNNKIFPEFHIQEEPEHPLDIDCETYTLNINVDNSFIYFTLIKKSGAFNSTFKSQVDLTTIVKSLELPESKYTNLYSVLELIESIRKTNKIKVKKDDNNNDSSLSLLLEINNDDKLNLYEIKLNKIISDDDEKFSFLFNEIEKLYEINKSKDKIIKQLQLKISDQEKEIDQIKNKLNIVDNIDNFNDNLINEESISMDIKSVNNNNLDEIKILKNEIKEINKKYNYLFKISKYNPYSRYLHKINYKFCKDPQNLKFNCDVVNTNTPLGCNDTFEIFVSFKDNMEYLVSPNRNNYNLDVINIVENKIIVSRKGHKNTISSIRYFINIYDNFEEYLVSADKDNIVFVWDVTNNYIIKYKINTNYKDDIYSCLMVFNASNTGANILVTSSYNSKGKEENASTKLYSMSDGEFLKYIPITNEDSVYYLLSWFNKKNSKHYIIQFCYMKITINNLLEDEIYAILVQEPEENHFCGFIEHREKTDLLYSSSNNGYINVWDLYKKELYNVIDTGEYLLCYMIQWNEKFIIVADCNNKSFKIVDIEKNEVVKNIGGQHKKEVICVKKFIHPLFGESLLTADCDKTIKLWTI